MEQKQIHPVDEKLPLGKNLILAFQHLFIAILAGIPVPLVIGAVVGLTEQEIAYFISSMIFTAAICTLLATVGLIKNLSPQIPTMVGITFGAASVIASTLNSAATHAEGFRIMAGSMLISGLFCFLVAPLWSKLDKLFPPVVIGTNLLILSISLVPNAFGWIMSSSSTGKADKPAFFLALFVFLLNIVFSKYLKGFLGTLNVLFCLIIGTLVAIPLGMIDFTAVKEAAWFGVVLPFHYGLPKVGSFSTTLSFLIVMILGMVEISGTVMGIHSIVGKEMNKKQLTRTLQTIGLGTMFSASFNSGQPVTYIQNVGLLDLTRVHSRFVTATAGVMMLGLSFFPKFAAFVSVIPQPVLGGIGIPLFGVILASGVNLLKNVKLDENNNMLVFGLSVAVAMIPASFPEFYGNFPQIVQDVFGNGLLAGSVTAISLNLFFNFKQIIGREK
ncbi:uracil-xanthine permease [Enterococcus sp. PF1-24]|uniref:uracil-xanthine permease family protein n=1 Tax=unclassified Enterococcus TaxID=2608891 RepID=UPI0024744166|nr:MULTISPECIES: solute carrier family 23 protein [unclassified Enterococcus]MDH6365571.1 uracil-xanthine permease [Enterococcus sp. PFB1-1]MDH6402673.1 uracil-xanthine permease [Enterococcus sp. PF1-24]